MKTKFLLAPRYKILGWIILLPMLPVGILVFFGGYEPEWLDWQVPMLLTDNFGFLNEGESGFKIIRIQQNNVADEISGSLILIGCLLLLLSKERDEDEFIMKLRLESILWAAIVNGLVLLFGFIFIYDISFFYLMTINLYLLFFLYIIRFHWVLLNFRKSVE